MQVENEVLNDKTLMIDDSILSNKLSSLKQQPEINRARKWLLVLIRTLLVSSQKKDLIYKFNKSFFVFR
jgi:hypothetical protein